MARRRCRIDFERNSLGDLNPSFAMNNDISRLIGKEASEIKYDETDVDIESNSKGKFNDIYVYSFNRRQKYCQFKMLKFFTTSFVFQPLTGEIRVALIPRHNRRLSISTSMSHLARVRDYSNVEMHFGK